MTPLGIPAFRAHLVLPSPHALGRHRHAFVTTTVRSLHPPALRSLHGPGRGRLKHRDHTSPSCNATSSCRLNTLVKLFTQC